MITMNGTSTHGGPNTTYSSAERPGCDLKRWASGMVCLWNNWSIQLLVLLCLIFQIVLALSGSRRNISAKSTRSVIWVSYSLSSYLPALVLSKLTSVSLDNSGEAYIIELKALLAPLALILLGNPDSITAYSLEDNWLGLRRVLNLAVTFPFAVWILVRSWKTSIRMMLYFPAYVAGIIEFGNTIWAIYSVYNENMIMKPAAPADFEEKWRIIRAGLDFPKEVPDLEIFLKAYYRFDLLKPHVEERLKYPFVYLESSSKLIDGYSPRKVFLTTDIELGFMYDVLYTKAPILYTKAGITLRVISYFSLMLTLGGFMGLFSDKLLRDPYVISTFGLLIGVVLLESYQLLNLFCSDWLIIMNRKHLENKRDSKILKFLAKRSLKKKRWSNEIRQFNMLDFCRPDEKGPWHFKVLAPFGEAEKFRRYQSTKHVQIEDNLKELLLKGMEKIEKVRGTAPFTKRGEWTLGTSESEQKLRRSIEMTFDRSIIIWHIATDVCNYSCPEDSDYNKASKLISEYMMFLLVQQPDILSLTTAEITYHHTYTNLKTFFKEMPDVEDAREFLGGSVPVPDKSDHLVPVPDKSDGFKVPIADGWNVLEDVRRLASALRCRGDRWELISSVWVEMLCFAAYNCQLYHHAKLLRRGGDIITHVWLLLQHKTDKFSTILRDTYIE